MPNEEKRGECNLRFQASGSYTEDDGYSFSVCGKDNVLFTIEGLTEEEVIYFRDLLDVILPEDKCLDHLNHLNAADDPSPPA
jgi:hypothetical protein